MVKFSFDDNKIDYTLYPYNQNGSDPGVHLKDENSFIEWKKRFDAISDVIADEEALNEKYEILLKKTEAFSMLFSVSDGFCTGYYTPSSAKHQLFCCRDKPSRPFLLAAPVIQ